MKSVYFPVILAIFGGVLYHVSQKSIPKAVNPLVALVIAYITGILILLLFNLFNPTDKPFLDNFKEIHWSMLTVGLGAAMIEVGFLLAYRTGGNISLTSTLMSAAVSVLLIPIGIAIFKEQVSICNMLGVIFCILGVVLLAKK